MADFTFNPDNTFEEKPQYNTLVTEFEAGAEQRRQKWSRSKRTWRLRFTNRPKAEAQSVLSFFDSKKGRLTSFTFDSPIDGTEYTVRFDQDDLALKPTAFDVYNFEVRLVEVF